MLEMANHPVSKHQFPLCCLPYDDTLHIVGVGYNRIGTEQTTLVVKIVRRVEGCADPNVPSARDRIGPFAVRLSASRLEPGTQNGTSHRVRCREDAPLPMRSRREGAGPATVDELAEEWGEEEGTGTTGPAIDPELLEAEIAELKIYRDLALSIGSNAKGEKLVEKLPEILAEIVKRDGQEKAVIFTESVRTQKYSGLSPERS